MQESTVADFPARYNLADGSETKLTDARVMMSRERFIVAGDGRIVTAPHAAIGDIAINNAALKLDVGSEDAVSISYDSNGTTHIVTIAADPCSSAAWRAMRRWL